MGLYGRFLAMLALGLSGLTVVLVILMERLFVDWDMFGDLVLLFEDLSEGKFLKRPSAAQEAAEAPEPQETGRYLKTERPLRQADDRPIHLRGPNGPIVLTPLPRAPASPVP